MRMLSAIPKMLIAPLAAGAIFLVNASAQTPVHIEPGLEKAVHWKWQAEPSSAQTWGLALPATMQLPESATVPPATGPTSAALRPTDYVVKRGDALALIAKRFHTSVAQLKQANGLTSDTIRIGQMLILPPPLPAPTPGSRASAGNKTEASPANLDTLTLQVFLDREQFSPGPIDGQRNPIFERVQLLYQGAHADAREADALLRKARAAVPEPLTSYALKSEDFRFIAPPKAERASGKAASSTGGKRKPAAAKFAAHPRPTYDELATATMLAYRSPWEFVAERFHCDERYLRKLNPQLPGIPAIGAEFRVPNVIPFAIEKTFLPPLQPAADPRNPVAATVTGLTLLEISRGGVLVAVMPLSIARPGLRGKGTWTILGAIPRPRLMTRREPLVKAEAPKRIFGRDDPDMPPPPTATPIPMPEYLAAGPRNPVGIFWIDLAKDGGTEPLPYGLHGTSVPDHMTTQQSLGGLRLTNWDVARAVRLLPVGTSLEWKPLGPVAPTAAAARPAP